MISRRGNLPDFLLPSRCSSNIHNPDRNRHLFSRGTTNLLLSSHHNLLNWSCFILALLQTSRYIAKLNIAISCGLSLSVSPVLGSDSSRCIYSFLSLVFFDIFLYDHGVDRFNRASCDIFSLFFVIDLLQRIFKVGFVVILLPVD